MRNFKNRITVLILFIINFFTFFEKKLNFKLLKYLIYIIYIINKIKLKKIDLIINIIDTNDF